MDDVQNLADRLQKGESVDCPKCQKGILIPFNESVGKAHRFDCNQKSCGFYIRWCEPIDIEKILKETV